MHGVQTLDDARALLEVVEPGRCRDVVIVGAGYIGLEMAEAFHRRGAQVTLVDSNDHVMGRTLDPDIADLPRRHADPARDRGAAGRAGRGFEGGRVITGPAPSRPTSWCSASASCRNSELAEEAGLELGERGAIRVDRRQRTSTDGV